MVQGNDPIGAILDNLAALERTMTPPTGLKLPHIYDEVPVDPDSPSIINVWRGGRPDTTTSSTIETTELIDVVFLFGRASEKYSERAQRLWIPVFVRLIHENVKLNDGTVQNVEVERWSAEPFPINEVPYIATTFTLSVHLAAAFDYLP